ncbi:TraX family protein, partial [Streptococcus sp. DD11]|uniref:TraX family protein n=1 Tax=Streptococcus sp. DD11 TaxID=1777879 RepID=UPI001F4940C4
HNIFLTLACGVLMLGLFFGFSENSGAAKDRKRGLQLTAAVLVLLAGLLICEGGMVLLPFMLLTYLFRNQLFFRNLAYIIWAGVLFAMSIQIYPTLQDTLSLLLYNSDWLFITVLPLIYLYNGRRGSRSIWSKYFFYVFYPAHLWLIAWLAFWVK